MKNNLYYSGDIDLYKIFRKKISTLSRQSKPRDCTTMPILTKIWKIWNRTKRTKKNSKPWSDPLTVRNKYTDDPNKISDVLNIHFSSVGRKLASKIPPTTCNFTEYLSGNYSESFFFNSVTALEIEKETFSIPLNKAQPESWALLSTFCRNLLQTSWICKMTRPGFKLHGVRLLNICSNVLSGAPNENIVQNH